MRVDAADRIDIRKLIIPEPRVEKPFDIDELVEEVWPKLMEDLNGDKDQQTVEYYLMLAADCAMLRPDRLEDLETVKIMRDMAELTDKEVSGDTWNSALRILHQKVLFPEDKDLEKSRKGFFALMKRAYQNRINAFDWAYGLIERLAAQKIVYPKEFDEYEIGKQWYHPINALNITNNVNDAIPFFEVAANARIIFPEEFKDIVPSSEIVKSMAELVKLASQSGRLKEFSKFALEYKIVTAESVEITDKGLEIKMKDKPAVEEPQLSVPETRRF